MTNEDRVFLRKVSIGLGLVVLVIWIGVWCVARFTDPTYKRKFDATLWRAGNLVLRTEMSRSLLEEPALQKATKDEVLRMLGQPDHIWGKDGNALKLGTDLISLRDCQYEYNLGETALLTIRVVIRNNKVVHIYLYGY